MSNILIFTLRNGFVFVIKQTNQTQASDQLLAIIKAIIVMSQKKKKKKN